VALLFVVVSAVSAVVEKSDADIPCEDKLVITFSYKDGTKSVSLTDVEGSDLARFGAPVQVCLQHTLNAVSIFF